MNYRWQQSENLQSKSYVCSYCGNSLASEKGYTGRSEPDNGQRAYIYICHHCNRPTYFDNSNNQTPGARFGNNVSDVDDEGVRKLYTEARDSYSAKAFTASVLSCRKLLMHIAVSKGAKENLKFIDYVEYLSEKNYIPPDAKGWVDHIRNKGNEANHEIVIMGEEDARDLVSFIEMLLKIIYEFPANIKKKMSVKPIIGAV